MIKLRTTGLLMQLAVFGIVSASSFIAKAVTIPNTPLVTQVSAKPMVMLVASKDHKLFFEAYNDASDLDGDGTLDIRFRPTIKYYGLFDYDTCYTYSSNLFTPSSVAGTNGSCSGKWSGRWLNYVTTSRIDALRKVLYGGYREVDTATQTILRRAYIPQDGHSWAKEYTSSANDGYKISDYTPLSEPTGGKRHFFGNLTRNARTNCSTLNNCSDLQPTLAVVTNSSKRVWEWASKERPVLDGSHGGNLEDYSVRVAVCTAGFTKDCKSYPDGPVKPIGLLHDYGANGSMLFGLLTGSYNKNMSGGVLRKAVSKFIDDDNLSDGEVNPKTGIFTSNATIVKAMNSLRIRDFNNGSTGTAYRNGSFRTGPMAEGDYVDWGNPVGEMMYEALRYFAGKGAPTSAFSTSGSHDAAVGLSAATWDDPYSASSKAKAPWCARANTLVMSDVYTSYDADQVPGSPYTSATSDIVDFNVGDLLKTISSEPGVKGNRFAGQTSSTNNDYAPTPKPVTDLSTVRGLAPEEATKQGSYTAAGVAYYGQLKDINTTVKGVQKLDTYVVALSSTLPKIEVPIGGKTIQFIPFAKTVDGAGTDRKKGAYQATDQIVDFYVSKDGVDANGLREMVFRINFEADEQGNDYDMDVIAEYTVRETAGGQVSISVEVLYQATGSNQNVGYVVSGSNRDGIYLVAQDKVESLNYFLNVPQGQSKGYCDSTTGSDPSPFPAGCNQLPVLGGATAAARVSTQTFSFAAGTTSDQYLKDPLWYAAKWGKFNDLNANQRPDLDDEWDLKRGAVAPGEPVEKGVPDNYFQVQNPLRLKDALKVAFDGIADVDSSASNVISNSANTTNTESQDLVFQARFASKVWSGIITAYPISGAGVSSVYAWQSTTPAAASRKIFANTSTGPTEFLWANLSSTDQSNLGDDPDVLDFLRGVRTKEVEIAKAAGAAPGDQKFRDRSSSSVIGDIVHSSPFYAVDGTVETIYVGANDGMLHAFNAKTGVELFGFIPREATSRLKNLTSPAYVHDYYVDGDVVVSPKTASNKIWLYSLLGRGGKGLFSLDVTVPSAVNASKFLWEYTPSASAAAAADNDLGFMLGQPVYAKMNNGMDALIVGNGYNSTNGRSVLYIFLIDSAGAYTVKKLVTNTPLYGDNGLSGPGVFDVNTDGKIDVIYAGDLQGNVWKFDVSDGDPNNWKVDLGGSNGTPFFVARNASNQVQPIVAPISVGVNTVLGSTHYGKRYIFFGTGSYFRTTDPTNTDIQTWYGLIDEGTVIASRSNLKNRPMTICAYPDPCEGQRTFPKATNGDMVGKNGWYVDFSTSTKERIVTESVLMRLAVPTLLASSIIPVTDDPCTPGGNGYLNAIDPFTGGATTVGILDVNKDKNFDNDKLYGNYIGSVDLGIGMPSRPSIVRAVVAVGGTSAEIGKRIGSIGVNLGLVPIKGRISWRELLKD